MTLLSIKLFFDVFIEINSSKHGAQQSRSVDNSARHEPVFFPRKAIFKTVSKRIVFETSVSTVLWIFMLQSEHMPEPSRDDSEQPTQRQQSPLGPHLTTEQINTLMIDTLQRVMNAVDTCKSIHIDATLEWNAMECGHCSYSWT